MGSIDGINMSDEIIVIEVKESPIELYKLLKLADLVQSGGEAKFVISEGQVQLNGVVEIQKRKKIIVDDLIEFNSQKLRIAIIPKE